MSALLSHPLAPAVIGAAVLLAWYFWPALSARWNRGASASGTSDADTIESRLAAYAQLLRALQAAACRDAVAALDTKVLPHLFHEAPEHESDQ